MVTLTNIGPETYNHLPPSSYPLLISLPFLIVILLKFWKASCIKKLLFGFQYQRVIYSISMLLLALVNEYTFLVILLNETNSSSKTKFS
jgi:hypothetical protein